MTAWSHITAEQRREIVNSIAGSCGFAACGICGAEPIERRQYVLDWLAAGRHGQMAYLERNVETRLDPRVLLPGARSVIVVAWLYRVKENPDGEPAESTPANDSGVAPVGTEHGPLRRTVAPGAFPVPACTLADDSGVAPGPVTSDLRPSTSSAHIARYAWGRDYHRVIRTRLRRFVDQLRAAIGEPFGTRICVDTAPLLEREMAQRAGLGWIGNNCLVLSRSLGSYFCLGAVVTTLELVPDEPAIDHCGTCTRCLQACPTGALVAPKQMDPRLCISYLTIERCGDFPDQNAPDLAGQIFGCDICQQVCPYNNPKGPVSTDLDAQPRWPAGSLRPAEVLSWDQAQWDAATQGRSLRRATLEMWRRNARLCQKPD